MAIEQDYILRLARQIALAVARMMGLAKRGRPDDAVEVAEATYGDLFGLPPGLIDRIDAAALIGILGSEEKRRAMADLLRAEAEAHDGRGDAARAAQRRALADGIDPSRARDG